MRSLILFITALSACAAIVSAQGQIPGADDIKRLEQMAETGDTAALHRVLEYYDINAPVVLAAVSEEGIGYDDVCQDTTKTTTPPPPDTGTATSDYFTSRLQYWLEKGLANNDPLATYITGIRLYDKNDAKAMSYLERAAEMGNVDAMMFCGSIYFDAGSIDKAIKYYDLAYKKDVPCAGWKLAGCYIKTGQYRFDETFDVIYKSANLGCPDAVRMMIKTDPGNPKWRELYERMELEEVQ